MVMNLKNRIALVTGSIQGIGLAIAESLADQGATLILHGLEPREEGGRRAAEFASRLGVEASYLPADLASGEEVAGLAEVALARHGRVDILVNNAGIQFTAPIEDFPLERWDAIQAVNLRAPFLLAKGLVPGMRAAGWGRIVNIASVHGLVGSIHKAAYCAAKHGLVGLTKVLALETATAGITVNAICPGWTETPILEPQFAARAAKLGVDRATAIRSMMAEKQPNQTLMPPAWIGETAAFLCSAAGQGITGAAIPVDGGWTAQ
jgi:3-hydroxybutyrate dehydrogenase